MCDSGPYPLRLRYGATEEFGLRDNHFEEDGEIISRATIEASIDGANAETYRILLDGEIVGGAVLSVDGNRGELELLFVNPEVHSKGIGYATATTKGIFYVLCKIWR